MWINLSVSGVVKGINSFCADSLKVARVLLGYQLHDHRGVKAASQFEDHHGV